MENSHLGEKEVVQEGLGGYSVKSTKFAGLKVA